MPKTDVKILYTDEKLTDIQLNQILDTLGCYKVVHDMQPRSKNSRLALHTYAFFPKTR